LDKGIITQQEYDQAVHEEEREEQREKQATAITKHGLEFKLGGFAEIDFIEDNTRSFQETVGNRPVLRSNTLAGANSQFVASPRNSLIRIDVQAPERDGIKARFHTSFDFLGNQPSVGTSGVSEFSAVLCGWGQCRESPHSNDLFLSILAGRGNESILSVRLEAAPHTGGFDELLGRVVEGTSSSTFRREDIEEL
jgi:hypothetical protein